MADLIFKFQPRWKEELVVTGPGGQFILDLAMGILTACLPTEEVWHHKAPVWAQDYWPQLHCQLKSWCAQNNAELSIDHRSGVYPVP